MDQATSAAISAIGFAKESLAASAHLVANVSTVKALDGPRDTAEAVIGVENENGGVRALRVAAEDPGVITYDPASPLANATGLVRHPALDVVGALAASNLAANLVRVNVVTIQTAAEAYRAATTVGATSRTRR